MDSVVITAATVQATLQAVLEKSVFVICKILVAILILFVGFKLIRVLMRKIKKGRGFSKLDSGMQTFLCNAISVVLKAVLLIGAAGYLGFPVASLVTALGSVFIAVGLALQGSLSNVSGGVLLLLFKPFKVGDYIIVRDGQGGTVQEIGLFYTTLLTADNRKVVIPNAEISNEQLINVTAMPTRRADISFSVAYAADIETVKITMCACAAAMNSVLQSPEPVAQVTEYGDSAITVTLRVWCKTENYWQVYYDLSECVKRKLDEAGVEIPFPQLDVHIKTE